jgi:hypothetical protein
MFAAFNEFIHDRESKRSSSPEILLFDQIILSKRNRGKSVSSLFSKSNINFLEDTSEHLWRSAAAIAPSNRFPGDYRAVTSRSPAKLDPTLMREPRANQGVGVKVQQGRARGRKPIPSMLGGKPNGRVVGSP